MFNKQDTRLACAGAIETIRAAEPARPFVVAQLGQSLDGRIATAGGDSRWINGAGALDHLHRLRAAVDAVVIGVGTALADDPRLDVRRCAGQNPARVVIDPHCRLPPDALVWREDGARRVLVHGREAAPPGFAPEAIAIAADGRGALAPKAIVAALFARGFRRLLVEGGAHTISRFMDAGMIDRLHLLVAPLIIGSGKAGLELAEITRLADAARPPTRIIALPDGDVLFDCDLRGTGAAPSEERTDVDDTAGGSAGL